MGLGRWPGLPGRFGRAVGALAAGVAVVAGGAFLVLPLLARAVVRGIELFAVGCIWLASSITSGVSVWSIISTLWRTSTSALATPALSVTLWGLVFVGLVAFYWLQRLLGTGDR
jgi:hypothetical protein